MAKTTPCLAVCIAISCMQREALGFRSAVCAFSLISMDKSDGLCRVRGIPQHASCSPILMHPRGSEN